MLNTLEKFQGHLEEARTLMPYQNIVGLFLQGAQNYSLETKQSDVDTKLIVTPELNSIIFNKKPLSTTHIRENNEHIDMKDIRLYMESFRKQNINFVEILFTKYKYINPLYQESFNLLIENREIIAHANTFQAVKCMKGMALEKFAALEHHYPSKEEVLRRFGYDPKQLHHILRMEDFLTRYISGESYEKCLIPTKIEYLKNIKLGSLEYSEAIRLAKETIQNIKNIADTYTNDHVPTFDPEANVILNDTLSMIMKISIKEELK